MASFRLAESETAEVFQTQRATAASCGGDEPVFAIDTISEFD